MDWSTAWSDVRDLVRSSRSKAEAVHRVSAIRPTTWDALARAWRRREVTPIGAELGSAVYVDPVLFVERPRGRKHLVIPDTQCKPGVPLDHLRWIGRYIAAKRPDVLIHLGDHWDMPSLSFYDSPKKKASRGIWKKGDIDAGNEGLEILENELERANFQPQEKYILEGNHDGFAPGGRIYRYLEEHPEDEGLITPDMFADAWLPGWQRVPFLQPVEVDGVLYNHLFPLNANGDTTSMSLKYGCKNASVQLRAVGQSSTAGHKQGLSTDLVLPPYGRPRRAIIAGSCYLHDEEYLGPKKYWRGILVKHDVSIHNPNHYELMEVSLDYLKRRYG